MHGIPHHKTDVMISLYRRYAEDLRRVRQEQRALYQTLSHQMFDDVEGEWVYLLVRYLGEAGPVRALEVGAGTGLSSSWMLRALRDNAAGHLLSFDFRVPTNSYLPRNLTQGRWTFVQDDAMACLGQVPTELDFMLIDSDHNSPDCDNLLDEMLPRTRSGGFAGVHDIYMLAEPGTGEALHVFESLEQLDIYPFTPAPVFPENWDAIQAVRTELDLTAPIHFSTLNSLLLFQMP